MVFSELIFAFLTSNQQFLSEHPKFSHNPLYISGTSYVGIIVPKVTLELYEGNSDYIYIYRKFHWEH
ncbi:putative peptidase S10, serine carboxypeptidase, alpha/Beta hydrolase [Helianthus anomalus]